MTAKVRDYYATECGTCLWCDEPLPSLYRVHTREPRIYCSVKCSGAARNTRDYRATEVEWLAGMGTAPADIVSQLDVKPVTLVKSLERAQRQDLALIIRPLVDRKHPCADCGTKVGHAYKRCRGCANRARRNRSAS